MNKRIIVILICFFLSFNLLYAQQEYLPEQERSKIIFNQLDKKSKILIQELKADEKKADELMDIADKYYKELSELREEGKSVEKKNKRYKIYKKMEKVENAALESRVNALDKYHDAAVRKYQIYKQDIQKLYKKTKTNVKDSAKILEKLAYNAFADADYKAQIAYHTVNHGEQFNIYTQAYILEQTGLLYQHEIYALLLGWGDNTVQHIDREINALIKNEPISSYTEDSIVKVVNDTIIEKVVVHDTITVMKEKPQLTYHVQIAASKAPISVKDLHKIYNAGGTIYTYVEDGWYKYSVGIFNSYHEAKKFKLTLGVKDAFVIAYKKGKRINIDEALKEEKQ